MSKGEGLCNDKLLFSGAAAKGSLVQRELSKIYDF